jgi:hypothetical protein
MIVTGVFVAQSGELESCGGRDMVWGAHTGSNGGEDVVVLTLIGGNLGSCAIATSRADQGPVVADLLIERAETEVGTVDVVGAAAGGTTIEEELLSDL